MKIASLAVLLAALLLPGAVSAQEVQQQPPPPQTQGQRGDQSASIYRRWTKQLNGINLSTQQQQQVQRLLDQFAAQHPAGSPRDHAGVRALGEQIFGVLNPQQQAQLHQNIEALKARRRQHHMQEQGQPQPQMQGQPPMQPQQVQPQPPGR
ncbi:MAG: hypothetical protein WB615_04020 [Candidatus Tumulicola sp.]